ncbi:4-hydroxy-tetrahydrodipicolinate reductase [Coxiella endosymbiont of Ornithodoros maritimus]|uniref:4-hydroxy-tetrahydrodipicolinate reductase n=1 Tax=Coxiella endosymbiont of Ornithodoros maritimus TaxID=1656172 RepID=UPI002264F0B4|nr:4-hydroxy-tetrahydrodipicolinate reductase [Coxiella endosymbiont of Ornithodoros maritimus]
MTINVIINGINGKMGRLVKENITAQPDFELMSGTGRQNDLAKTIQTTHADVVIDFTTPQSVFHNAEIIVQSGARPVIGTTGLTLEQIALLDKRCRNKKLGAIVAPNFSVGAVLMMKYAKEAARYFPDVEIIEMHHSQKIDAPSGTAMKTAQMIGEMRPSKKEEPFKDRARGEIKNGIPIHSIRLPGLFSHQSVIFGSNGETLTIRHDGMDRNCTMPGIFLACRKVMELDYLVYGLEKIL